jgi:hypothetical protein
VSHGDAISHGYFKPADVQAYQDQKFILLVVIKRIIISGLELCLVLLLRENFDVQI